MRTILGCVMLASAVASADAANTYSFATDKSSYDVSQGTALVKVYLQENGSPSTLAAEGGLDGAAFSVTRSPGETGAQILGLAFNPLFDAGFPLSDKSESASFGSLTETTNFGSPGVGFDAEHPTWTYLGSITLAPDAGSQTTTFTIGGYDATGYFATHDLTTLDPTPGTVPTSTSFSVVVPEPLSLGVCALGLMTMGLMRRRGMWELELYREDVRVVAGVVAGL